MTVYMTPGKYRSMGFGVDLDGLGVEDVELAAILSRSSAIADSYCTVPRLPRPHSFLGGEITTEQPEQHFWRLPESDFDLGSRRVYPYHWPIKEITRFRVRVTNTQYVEIAPSELFINNTERYVEVISLAFTGVGLFGMIIPSIGLMKPVVEICYTYEHHFEALGDTLFPTDARTYRADNQFWVNLDPAETNIYVNGIEATTGFTIIWTEGAVVFDDPLDAGDIVTADYEWVLPQEIRDAVGLIATDILGDREIAARGMTGIARLQVAEVSMWKDKVAVNAENLSVTVPQAAWLLDGFRFQTIR